MKSIITSLCAGALLFGLASCSETKDYTALTEQSDRLNTELNVLAEGSPMFLDSLTTSCAENVITINVAFTNLDVKQISEPLAQFFVATYAKGHTGANLDKLVNELVATEGQLNLHISNAAGESVDYVIPGKRLKQLVTAKLMDLNFNSVKTNINDILESNCDYYKDLAIANNCEYALANGFAQYTVTFANPAKYAGVTNGSLAGRYLKIMQKKYDEFGDCRDIIEEVLQSVNIEGYRFIYTDENNKKTLKAALPWRLIDNPMVTEEK